MEIHSTTRALLFAGCAAGALGGAAAAAAAGGLPPAASRGLFLLLFAAGLWMTEAIPPFAVGIGVIGAKIALLGRPEGVFARTPQDWEQFVLVLGHPLVWLFFGGFVLAAAMHRTGLDRRLAAALLGRLGDRPSTVLLGVMGVTAAFSMFVSNTATTAMMLAVLAPLFAAIPEDDPLGTGLLLGVATAANVGGMGTLIGTPPNAIAVGVLGELPGAARVSFLDWMLIGLPLGGVLLALAWAVLVRLYPSGAPTLRVPSLDGAASEGPAAPRWQRGTVVAVLLATVGLWLTSQWHGIPTAAVSFLPIVVFTATGVLGTAEIRGLPYDVLFLLAGGLALGQTVTETGLSTWLVARLPSQELGPVGLALAMAYGAALVSNFMSNTAAANILVPLGASLAVGGEAPVVLPIALAASSAMCMPVATPPNALVFATGRCHTRDFLRVGLLMGALAPGAAVLWVTLLGGALWGAR